MVEVRKRENESSGNLLRRFSKRVQRSGFLLRAKKRRYRPQSKSEFQKKKEALRRVAWQKNMDKLRKLGKENPPR